MKSLKLLSKIALSFQNLNDFDRSMNEILEDIGEFLDVSRIYIFLNDNKDIVSNTFEWFDEGICPQIQDLQKFNYEDMPSFKDLLINDGCICSNDINDLPLDIKESLKVQDIKSIAIFPLIIKEEKIGFIGFDECRYKRKWKEDEIEILSTISGLVSNAYERRLAQEDLIVSRTNLYNFFETIEDMFTVTDLDGKIVHCNRSLIDKLGYSLLELKGMNISKLNPAPARLEASNRIEEVLEGRASSCNVEVESKFGDVYWVNTRVWFGKWNKKDCIFSISKDITKENENLQLFSTIFENNPLPMTITNIDEGRVLKINPEFTYKTGYRECDIVGKRVEELDLFIDQKKLEIITNKQLKGEEIIDQELFIRCKDGSPLIGLFSIEEITLEGKKALLTVMVDVTDRVELTNSVEDKCQKLTNIIESTNLGTWEWNIQTGQVTCNNQWANMLGYSLEELEPLSIETWRRLAHPEDLLLSDKIIRYHLKNNIPFYDSEVRMKHKDGRWVWIQDRGKVTELDIYGKPLMMFGTHSDINLRKEAEKTLKESEKRFFLALDRTEAGLWDMDLINRSIFLSPMWKNILGYEDNEIENSLDAWKDLIHPDDLEKIMKTGRDYLQGKSDTYEAINRLKHKDGDWRWILTRGGILNDEDGIPSRWIGTIIDITLERKQSLELERFFSISLDLLCLADLEGNFLKANKAWEDILGYPPEELQTSNFLNYIHPDDLDKTLNTIEKLKKGEKIPHFINRYMKSNGEYRYIEWRSNPYESILYASGRDITDRVQHEKTILEMSYKDSLTNVYNRRYIFSRAREIIEEYKRTKKSFSLCIIDIDNFKRINDSYGHQAGDHVLKEFTKVINKNLRPYDLLGRYGGEEFIIILKDIDAKNSKIVVKRILKIIREKTFHFNGEDIEFTFSAGISTSSEVLEGEIIDKLIQLADRRMYHAKKIGKNNIIFQAEN